MWFLLTIGFIFTLLLIGLWLWTISLYNKLIHLQMSCIHTLDDLIDTWTKKHAKILDPERQKLMHTAQKASSTEKKATVLNQIFLRVAEHGSEHKSAQATATALHSEKRFYLHTVRELTEHLAIFPTNIIGWLFGIQVPPLLDLTPDEKVGIPPEAIW
jgi:hypothetical protein